MSGDTRRSNGSHMLVWILAGLLIYVGSYLWFRSAFRVQEYPWNVGGKSQVDRIRANTPFSKKLMAVYTPLFLIDHHLTGIQNADEL